MHYHWEACHHEISWAPCSCHVNKSGQQPVKTCVTQHDTSTDPCRARIKSYKHYRFALPTKGCTWENNFAWSCVTWRAQWGHCCKSEEFVEFAIAADDVPGWKNSTCVSFVLLTLGLYCLQVWVAQWHHDRKALSILDPNMLRTVRHFERSIVLFMSLSCVQCSSQESVLLRLSALFLRKRGFLQLFSSSCSFLADPYSRSWAQDLNVVYELFSGTPVAQIHRLLVLCIPCVV